jgi:hypothetical protein
MEVSARLPADPRPVEGDGGQWPRAGADRAAPATPGEVAPSIDT